MAVPLLSILLPISIPSPVATKTVEFGFQPGDLCRQFLRALAFFLGMVFGGVGAVFGGVGTVFGGLHLLRCGFFGEQH